MEGGKFCRQDSSCLNSFVTVIALTDHLGAGIEKDPIMNSPSAKRFAL